MELVTPDIGRPFYRAVTTLDALALIETLSDRDGAEGGSNSLRRWRRRESNPRNVPGKGGPGERAQGALGAGRGGRDGGDRERVLRAGGVIPHDIRPQLPNYRGDDAE